MKVNIHLSSNLSLVTLRALKQIGIGNGVMMAVAQISVLRK